jgi:hypothetical protein
MFSGDRRGSCLKSPLQEPHGRRAGNGAALACLPKPSRSMPPTPYAFSPIPGPPSLRSIETCADRFLKHRAWSTRPGAPRPGSTGAWKHPGLKHPGLEAPGACHLRRHLRSPVSGADGFRKGGMDQGLPTARAVIRILAPRLCLQSSGTSYKLPYMNFLLLGFVERY